MGDTHDPSTGSQIVAALQHDKLSLQTRLADVQLENQVLRKQLYHMSTLLDVAVSKLGTLGVGLETPIDIRALRAEAMKHASAEAEQKAGFDSGDLSAGAKAGDLQSGAQKKKRFHLRTQLREHTKAVQCCAFASGDDTMIVTGGHDCRMIIQNFFSGEKLWDITGHDELVSDVAWFDGTSSILSASFDCTVKLWDPKRTERTPLYTHEASGFVLTATPLHKGHVFACADSRRRTSIVDVRAPKPISWWDLHSRVNSIAFDGSVAQMLMGHSDGSVSVWDMRRVRSAGGSSAPSQEIAATAVSALLQGALSSSTPGGGQSLSGAAPHSPSPDAPPSVTESAAPIGSSGSFPFPCVSHFSNDLSRASIDYLAHYHSSDDTKRLVCVSDDNMVRVYRGNLNASTASRNASDLYHLRNVLPGVAARGFPVRSGFWKGNTSKLQVSVFLDDVEKDAEVPARRLTECDLLVTGGADNSAVVFDVTEENGTTIVERLEGHRDRVTGAVIHHSDSRPIIATTSSDSTVRIWVPAKT